MSKRKPSLTALLTLFFYSTFEFASFAPAYPVAPLLSSEIRIPTPSVSFTIPRNLGTLQTLQSGNGPFIIHLQTAHGNYSAQKKIQALLHYLRRAYGIKLLFLEGSAFKLDPRVLDFLPRHRPVLKRIHEQLAKKSLLNGAELFLLDRPSVEAYGIEDLHAYRSNGRAFRSVFAGREELKNSLQQWDSEMDRQTLSHLNKNLKKFLQRFEDYESRKLPIHEWMQTLKENALKYAHIDLKNPAYQMDWPMLVRVSKLEEMEQKLDLNAFARERSAFLKEIREYLRRRNYSVLDSDSYRQFEKLFYLPQSQHSLASGDVDRFFEAWSEFVPVNLHPGAYPNVRYYLGHLVLRSELSGQRLVGEMDRLKEKIADAMASKPEEKRIWALRADYRLLKKSFSLELTPQEYDSLLFRNRKPSVIRSEFSDKNSKKAASIDFGKMDHLYDRCMKFYRGAKNRDRWMLRNIVRSMKERGINKVVVVTGGFHARPFQEYFRENGFGYALITPQIIPGAKEAAERENYIRSVLQNEPNFLNGVASTYESPLTEHAWPERIKLHPNPRFLLGEEIQTAMSEARPLLSADRTALDDWNQSPHAYDLRIGRIYNFVRTAKGLAINVSLGRSQTQFSPAKRSEARPGKKKDEGGKKKERLEKPSTEAEQRLAKGATNISEILEWYMQQRAYARWTVRFFQWVFRIIGFIVKAPYRLVVFVIQWIGRHLPQEKAAPKKPEGLPLTVPGPSQTASPVKTAEELAQEAQQKVEEDARRRDLVAQVVQTFTDELMQGDLFRLAEDIRTEARRAPKTKKINIDKLVKRFRDAVRARLELHRKKVKSITALEAAPFLALETQHVGRLRQSLEFIQGHYELQSIWNRSVDVVNTRIAAAQTSAEIPGLLDDFELEILTAADPLSKGHPQEKAQLEQEGSTIAKQVRDKAQAQITALQTAEALAQKQRDKLAAAALAAQKAEEVRKAREALAQQIVPLRQRIRSRMSNFENTDDAVKQPEVAEIDALIAESGLEADIQQVLRNEQGVWMDQTQSRVSENLKRRGMTKFEKEAQGNESKRRFLAEYNGEMNRAARDYDRQRYAVAFGGYNSIRERVERNKTLNVWAQASLASAAALGAGMCLHAEAMILHEKATDEAAPEQIEAATHEFQEILQDALDYVEGALTEDLWDAGLAGERAAILLDAGRFDDAIAQADQVLTWDEKNHVALMIKINASIQHGIHNDDILKMIEYGEKRILPSLQQQGARDYFRAQLSDFRRQIQRSEARINVKEPGKLLEELALTKDNVLERLQSPEIGLNMRKLNDSLRAEFPKRVPPINQVGGAAGLAIALGIGSEYRGLIEEAYRDTVGNLKETGRVLDLNDFTLKEAYRKLSPDEQETHLSDVKIPPGTLLKVVAGKINSGVLKDIAAANTLPANPQTKPHLLFLLRERAGQIPEGTVTPENVGQWILQWLEQKDEQGIAWNILSLKNELADLLTFVGFSNFSSARVIWGVGMQDGFATQYEQRSKQRGGIMTHIGMDFGWKENSASKYLEGVLEDLDALQTAYEPKPKPKPDAGAPGASTQAGQTKTQAHGQIEDISQLKILEALGMTSEQVVAELNLPEVDWNFTTFIDRHAAVIGWIKSRGFEVLVASVKIEDAAREKVRERYIAYAGVMNLIATSFGMGTISALNNLAGYLGVDFAVVPIPEGNLLATFGVKKEDILRELEQNGWSNVSKLKSRLIAQMKDNPAASKIVFEDRAISHAEVIWGVGIMNEFIAVAQQRLAEKKGSYNLVGASFGWPKGSAMRTLKDIFSKGQPPAPVQLLLSKPIVALEHELSVIVPGLNYSPRMEKLAALKSQYEALAGESAKSEKTPEVQALPVPELSDVWKTYREAAGRKDFEKKTHPTAVLIHRPLTYDWEANAAHGIVDSTGADIFEKTVRDIQAFHPMTEYFWVEIAPVALGNRIVPAVYFVGYDSLSKKPYSVHRFVETKEGMFESAESPEGYVPVADFPQFLFQNGYRLHGDTRGIADFVKGRVETVNNLIALEKRPWDTDKDLLETGVQTFLDDSLVTDFTEAREAESRLGPSILEVPFYIQSTDLDEAMALAQALLDGKAQPIEFLESFYNSPGLRAMLGYQHFRLDPVDRLLYYIRDSRIEPDKALELAQKIARKVLQARSGALAVDRKVKPKLARKPPAKKKKGPEEIIPQDQGPAEPPAADAVSPVEVDRTVTSLPAEGLGALTSSVEPGLPVGELAEPAAVLQADSGTIAGEFTPDLSTISAGVGLAPLAVVDEVPIAEEAPAESLENKWAREVETAGKDAHAAIALALGYEDERRPPEIPNVEDMMGHQMDLLAAAADHAPNFGELGLQERIDFHLMTANLMEDAGGGDPKAIASDVEQARLLMADLDERNAKKEAELEQRMRSLDPENSTIKKIDAMKGKIAGIERKMQELERTMRSARFDYRDQILYAREIDTLEMEINAFSKLNEANAQSVLHHTIELLRLTLQVRIIEIEIRDFQRDIRGGNVKTEQDFRRIETEIYRNIGGVHRRFGTIGHAEVQRLRGLVQVAQEQFAHRQRKRSEARMPRAKTPYYPRHDWESLGDWQQMLQGYMGVASFDPVHDKHEVAMGLHPYPHYVRRLIKEALHTAQALKRRHAEWRLGAPPANDNDSLRIVREGVDEFWPNNLAYLDKEVWFNPENQNLKYVDPEKAPKNPQQSEHEKYLRYQQRITKINRARTYLRAEELNISGQPPMPEIYVGIDAGTHFLGYDPNKREGRFHHVDPVRGVTSFSLQFVDSLKAENPDHMELLANEMRQARRELLVGRWLLTATPNQMDAWLPAAWILEDLASGIAGRFRGRYRSFIEDMKSKDEDRKEQLRDEMEALDKKIRPLEALLRKKKSAGTRVKDDRELYNLLIQNYNKLVFLIERIGWFEQEKSKWLQNPDEVYLRQIEAILGIQEVDHGWAPVSIQRIKAFVYLWAWRYDSFEWALEEFLQAAFRETVSPIAQPEHPEFYAKPLDLEGKAFLVQQIGYGADVLEPSYLALLKIRQIRATEPAQRDRIERSIEKMTQLFAQAKRKVQIRTAFQAIRFPGEVLQLQETSADPYDMRIRVADNAHVPFGVPGQAALELRLNIVPSGNYELSLRAVADLSDHLMVAQALPRIRKYLVEWAAAQSIVFHDEVTFDTEHVQMAHELIVDEASRAIHDVTEKLARGSGFALEVHNRDSQSENQYSFRADGQAYTVRETDGGYEFSVFSSNGTLGTASAQFRLTPAGIRNGQWTQAVTPDEQEVLFQPLYEPLRDRLQQVYLAAAISETQTGLAEWQDYAAQWGETIEYVVDVLGQAVSFINLGRYPQAARELEKLRDYLGGDSLEPLIVSLAKAPFPHKVRDARKTIRGWIPQFQSDMDRNRTAALRMAEAGERLETGRIDEAMTIFNEALQQNLQPDVENHLRLVAARLVPFSGVALAAASRSEIRKRHSAFDYLERKEERKRRSEARTFQEGTELARQGQLHLQAGRENEALAAFHQALEHLRPIVEGSAVEDGGIKAQAVRTVGAIERRIGEI